MSETRTDRVPGFADFPLAPAIQRGITEAGFVDPRPIQIKTIPEALAGHDIMGLAQTGTGKTAAFVLPLLQRLIESDGRRGDGPRVLIVAPTRELATQIGEEIVRLARFTQVRHVTVFGGVSAHSQIQALRKRPEILVACPGRLLDLHRQGAVRLDRVEALVLDEADHMFDMGFLPDVRRILAALPEQRQNLLFSATMPSEIRRLAKQVLHRPHVVELGHSRPIDTIDHALYPVDSDRKIELLERILSEAGFVSAIVFTRTKHRAKRLARQLAGGGHRAVALQGNMSQNARERAMNGFRQGEFDVLVATDIAARGIDVEQVSHVVNFDMPMTPDAYTHRIGRTGRSERSGRAYTFVTADDHAMVRAVEGRIGQPIARKAIDGLTGIDASRSGAARPSPARNPAPAAARAASGTGRRRQRGRGGAAGATPRSTNANGQAGRPRRRSGRPAGLRESA